MSYRITRSCALGAAAVLAVALAGSSATSQESLTLEALAARAAALEREVGLLEDANAVEKLQRIYGFYTDKQLWTQAGFTSRKVRVGRSAVAASTSARTACSRS